LFFFFGRLHHEKKTESFIRLSASRRTRRLCS